MADIPKKEFMVNFPILSRDAILTSPINYDFGARIGEWANPFGVTQEELDSEEWKPMWNYIYPLPEFDKQLSKIDPLRRIAERIQPVTIIYILPEEEYFLALCAAGSDFTWDIADAYMECNYLPPYWCSKLPFNAGGDSNDQNAQEIIFGVLKTLEILNAKFQNEEKSHRYLYMANMEGYNGHGQYKGSSE